jgi:putative ABC transport system permease protein
MKTLGFSGGHLLGLIGGESMLIAVLGGAVGIAAIFPVVQGISIALRAWFPVFPIETRMIVIAAGAAVGCGIVAAVFPATRAIRMRIVDGLRRVG